ncbi:alpha-1,4-glucan--maltose-1-phosphate maltosyltransferase [Pedobacter deserti]|uniref:alpha-1,4-glucan--maltose-1-phosphate maltosyltransferase n=1 Tax=Pedobacter deserti TaxID=2817382 RepID=UPI00210AB0AB|nr:alpha-1,4-glucan--maltose-1-phosphate maltosyltransferase [Pedobacter sp. SYSU D00382]
MLSSKGHKRVIITNISPSVEEGKFPAKAVLDEEITISADVFGDGHDAVSASLFIKHIDEDKALEVPLKLLYNDCWQTRYTFNRLGFYEFWIEAWEDHFANWRNGLLKKHAAGQNLDVEWLIGTKLIDDAAEYLADRRDLLLDWVQRIHDADSDDEKVALVTNAELSRLMYQYRLEDKTTRYPFVFRIEVERKKAAYSTWYELFPRSAAAEPGKHGTFKDVIRLLPRIAEMGFDVLYFPPIHPIGEVNRKGKNNSLTAGPDDPGSPWAIGNRKGGHKAIHPQLGTMTDFKRLVKAAKAQNIEIALDIAYQCAPDHPYVKAHPEWFVWRPDGTVQFAENPPKKYEDILPFNFESADWEGLWKELKSVIDHWVAAGIRVFRIDNPHTKAFAFWEWMINEVRTAYPEVIFLAEAFTRPRIMERLAKVGFNQSYTYFTWRNTPEEIKEYMTELTKTELRYYFRPNFWPNTPDILPPVLVEGGENAHIMRLILAATLSSNYGLYGPVYEFGINAPHGQKEEYIDNEKYEIKHWDWDKETRIREIITLVNQIRRENPALQSTWNIEFAKATNEQLLCFVKVDERSGNRLIIAVNMDVWNRQSGMVTLPMKHLGIDYDTPFEVHDLLSKERYSWKGDKQYIELNPYLMPAHIFKVII